MTSKAVNVPTDVKTKEKDVNAKLQLFGIYEAFSKGKVPSNKQIDVAMNTALAWKQLQSPSKKLSPDGQKLVGDLRTVIEQAKLLLLSKNQGDLLQQFIGKPSTSALVMPESSVRLLTRTPPSNTATRRLRDFAPSASSSSPTANFASF